MEENLVTNKSAKNFKIICALNAAPSRPKSRLISRRSLYNLIGVLLFINLLVTLYNHQQRWRTLHPVPFHSHQFGLHPKRTPENVDPSRNLGPVRSDFQWDGRWLCSNLSRDPNDLSMVIMIHSDRANFEQRKLIRDSWGSINSQSYPPLSGWSISKVAFMVGDPDPQEDIQISRDLEAESIFHGDLVRRPFLDVYSNLVQKAIMSYEWIVEFCDQAKILVKTDDDVLTNIFQLARSLNELSSPRGRGDFIHSRTIYGFLYGASIKESLDIFSTQRPVYATGGAYVVTMKGVRTIVEELQRFNDGFVMGDDVFLLGLLPLLYNQRITGKMSEKNLEGEKEDGKFYHVQKRFDWYFLPVYLEGKDEELREWTTTRVENKTSRVTVDQSRKRKFVSTVFYVITHGELFSQDFKSGWGKIVQIEGI